MSSVWEKDTNMERKDEEESVILNGLEVSVCICDVCIYFLPLSPVEAMPPQQQHAKSRFQNAILLKRKHIYLEKWLILGWGYRKYS